MSANIITGYTGSRHITPAMDAAVYRSTFGEDNVILADGDRLAGSMPTINDFTILGGVVSMQGHQIEVQQETLSVDTCPNGYKRIDLVVMRFEHDPDTLIDDAALMVLKGTEVTSPNTAPEPEYNEGTIDQGATVVDFPLYRISMTGSTVTFERIAEVLTKDIKQIQEDISDLNSNLPSEANWYAVYGGGVCDAIIRNGIVFIKGNSFGSKSIGGSNYTDLTTLPARYRPTGTWYFPVGWSGSGLNMRINSDGVISFAGTAQTYWNFFVSYPARLS